jgi:hypothetical protein
VEKSKLLDFSIKKCSVCARLFLPGSNRTKYCLDCAARVHRKKEAERQRSRGINYQKLGKDMPYLFVKSWLPKTKISRTGTRSADNSANHVFFISFHRVQLYLNHGGKNNMEKQVYITEEERAKCQKVADVFAELAIIGRKTEFARKAGITP